jgi:diaminopimelate decarboxylase
MSFAYRDQQLTCDGLNVAEIATQADTPFYLYSTQELLQNFAAYELAFAGTDAAICFAVKACSNIAILKLLAAAGAGADTVSGGEIRRALFAGISPEKVIFSGVGKSEADIHLALESQIGQFNAESVEELEMLNQLASDRRVTAPISIRVNPDVDAGTHEKISTGRKSDKFGVPWQEIAAAYEKAKRLSHLRIEGIACHLGSQITQAEPFERSFARVAELARDLLSKGLKLQRIDLGGGLGLRYRDEIPLSVSNYAGIAMKHVRSLGLKLFLEPGRSIAASAGALIARVQLIKRGAEKSFVVLDAGMNDLARPAIYGAYHEIVSVREGEPAKSYDVVGPVCESSDVFGTQRLLPKLMAGDLVAILNAGAYGATMSSTYNSRPLLPEVLVEHGNFRVIRERQSFEEVIASERF